MFRLTDTTVSRTCRLCGDRPGTYRTVQVGDGLSRRWAVCDSCVDTLRGATWLSVDDASDPERVVLRVEPESLTGAAWHDET